MSISETVRATQTEESRQNQTYSQNFSANWQNRKVSILTPAAAGVAIGATAIAVAATVLTGGIALAAFAIDGVAIAAGLGTSLFFAFKTPTPLEQSRMEQITSQVSPRERAPSLEEVLAYRREGLGNEDLREEQAALKVPPSLQDILAVNREEFEQKKQSVEAEEVPTVEEEPSTPDKPEEINEVLQAKEESSYFYGKMALGAIGLAALEGTVYMANANGINLNPLSYFSSTGNPIPDPQPTPNPNQDVPEPASTNTSTPIQQENNRSYVFTPQPSQVRQPVSGSFVPVSDKGPIVTPMLSQCKAPTFNGSWVQSSAEGHTPAPVSPFTSDQCGLTPPAGFNASLTTPVPPVPTEKPEVTPLQDQSGLTSPANHSTSPTPEPKFAEPTPTPVVRPAKTPTPSETPAQNVVPSAQETFKPSVSQSANYSAPTVTPRTPRFTVELPKTEQETSWVSKECMKFGQTLSKRFSEPYNKFFTGKPKDAWTSSDHTGWKMMSDKDTCYYPPKATSISAARERRMPMVEFCNCMMNLWKTRNPAVTA